MAFVRGAADKLPALATDRAATMASTGSIVTAIAQSLRVRLLVNGAVLFPGQSVEFVLRRALETGRPVFVGFVADLDARVQVLDKLDEAVADICVTMILAEASRKR